MVDRLWLVFFSSGINWWCKFLKPGYGHISAAAWYDREKRWVHFNPCASGTSIEIWTHKEFPRRLGQLVRDASLILRVRSRHGRTSTAFGFWCVGSIKGLLGVRAGALSPYSLSRHLMRHGAEIVEGIDGQPVQTAGRAKRRPGHQASPGPGREAVRG